MLAGYALLDGKLVSSRFYPEAIGAQLANVPRNTFHLWNDYDLPMHLTAGGGAQFVDSRAARSTSPTDPATGLAKRAPGYWVFNAMAKYPLTDRLDLQLNVYNLTDKYYYDQIQPAHIVPGPARAAMAGVKFKFSTGDARLLAIANSRLVDARAGGAGPADARPSRLG